MVGLLEVALWVQEMAPPPSAVLDSKTQLEMSAPESLMKIAPPLPEVAFPVNMQLSIQGEALDI